jgi:hypothetical protein
MAESTAVTISFVLIQTLEVGRTLLSPGKRILFIAESPFGGMQEAIVMWTVTTLRIVFMMTLDVVVVNINHETIFWRAP